MKSKLFILLSLCVALLSSGCYYNQDHELLRPKVESSSTPQPNSYDHKITVSNQTLSVEIANTDASRELGLSGRTSIADNNGMLFDFTNTPLSMPGFWMKDMKFNIDIIWINNGKIIGINSNVPAPLDNTNLPIYKPTGEITQVLEVASGWCTRYNIKIGDSVKI